MQEYAVELVDVDILECLTFPWQLRLVVSLYQHVKCPIIPYTSSIFSNHRLFSILSQIIVILRIVQKIAMENLNKKWQEFIQADTASFYEEFDCDLSSGAFSN